MGQSPFQLMREKAMTKTLKKPSYLGTTSQVEYKQSLANADGSYAERHAAARREVGVSIVGQKVALVRVAGVEHVVAYADISTLPSSLKPHAFCTLEHCDENGAIFLTKSV